MADYEVVIGVDPGTRSVLVALDVNKHSVLDWRIVEPVTPEDYIKIAENILSKVGLDREKVLVGIEDQYLWLRVNDSKAQVKFRAIKSLLRSASYWHFTFGFLLVDSIEVPIQSWKSHCRIYGRDQKQKSLLWSNQKYANSNFEASDAFCIADYLLYLVEQDMIETDKRGK